MAATESIVEILSGSEPSLREELNLEGHHSLWDLSVHELLERFASTDPTRGGGSAAILTACMGISLLRKAFVVSLQRERRTTSLHHALEIALVHLDMKQNTLQNSADQDAAAFNAYIRVLQPPHGDSSETNIREKSQEEALIRATSTPVALAKEMHNLFRFALDHLPSICDGILGDAITGMQLLNSAAECLLFTAESNLAKVLNPVFQSTMSRQTRSLRHWTAQAESQLICRLQNRQLTRSS